MTRDIRTHISPTLWKFKLLSLNHPVYNYYYFVVACDTYEKIFTKKIEIIITLLSIFEILDVQLYSPIRWTLCGDLKNLFVRLGEKE